MTTSRLRLVLNTWTLCNLPSFSLFRSHLSPHDAVAVIRAAGYEGLQLEPGDRLATAGFAAGLHMSATGRVLTAEDADTLCKSHHDMGFALTTLHLGSGFETQSDGLRLMEAVLTAAQRHAYPLYIETHRATLTQDPRRTLDFLAAFPELKLNLDISHWYAGCELPYGDYDAKLAALQPVFERTRYIHGRIADSSCLQIPAPEADATPARHFHDLWRRAFAGFLATAPQDERICFAPELLPNAAILDGRHSEINYARLTPGLAGPMEETDRWLEAVKLCKMAQRAFADAQDQHSMSVPTQTTAVQNVS